jgi:serine/threonine protein kinase
LKPGNFLVDSQCGVKVCDFGLSRALPPKTNLDKELQSVQKHFYSEYFDSVTKVTKSKDRKNKFKDYKQKLSDYLVTVHKDQKRELTPEIMTRWYRAPEVCLTYKDYGKAIDIWSLGVILSELIYCSNQYVGAPNFDSGNRYLFNGSSSYPLSPTNKFTISSDDELVKIMQIYPDLDEEVDLSFLSRDGKNLGLKFFELSKPKHKSLKEWFPLTDESLLAILEEMLQINP